MTARTVSVPPGRDTANSATSPIRSSASLICRSAASRTGVPPSSVTRSPGLSPARSAADRGSTARTTAPAADRSRGREAGRREIVVGEPERAAADVAEFEHLVDQRARHVDRNGKAHAGIVLADGDEGGVDADEIAAQVHQGPAGIAGIDGGIGLDEILIRPDPHIGPVQAADDPGGHGLADRLRIADGEHEIPDLEAIGITEREFRQAIRAHLDDGHVGLGIGTDATRRQRAAVGELHRDLVGMVDDMTVGDDEPAARVEHHAGAEGVNFVPSRERRMPLPACCASCRAPRRRGPCLR